MDGNRGYARRSDDLTRPELDIFPWDSFRWWDMISRHGGISVNRKRWCAVLIFFLAVGSWVMVARAASVAVIDDRGKEIVLSDPPQRIVVVGAFYVRTLLDLGAIDRLVAVADSPENPPEVLDAVSVGPSFAPSVEVIVSLRPDLVLGATDWGGERPALESVGIPVLTTPILTSIPDVLASIRTVGAAIGRADTAAVLCGRIAEAVVEAEARVLHLPKVSAAFLYPPSPGVAPYVAGQGTIEAALIARAGGVNAFRDLEGFPQVSIEEVLARDPEVIFTAPSQVSFILDDPLLQGVAAVRLGRVFGIVASRAASSDVAEVLVEMTRLLHPE